MWKLSFLPAEVAGSGVVPGTEPRASQKCSLCPTAGRWRSAFALPPLPLNLCTLLGTVVFGTGAEGLGTLVLCGLISLSGPH